MRFLAVLVLGTLLVDVGRAELADNYLVPWVTRRAAELDQAFAARPMDAIGWADGMVHALKIAKKHQRPVFLFTLDGQMAAGRC